MLSITSFKKFCGPNKEKIFKLLNALDTKNAFGFDMFPIQLVKMDASVVC